MFQTVGSYLTRIGDFTAHPAAFCMVLVYAALWFTFEHHTFDWHAVATLATWLMTLVITRSQHRDTLAVHAKIDELLKVHGDANSELVSLDDKEPEEITRHRREARTVE